MDIRGVSNILGHDYAFNTQGTAYGTLRIDHSNPEKDVYRIELGDLDKLKKKRRIELTIDHNANLSQD